MIRYNNTRKKIFVFLPILIFFAALSSLSAQDATWLINVTEDAGLGDAYGSKIQHVDINNDNYPDLLFGTGGINKNTFRLYLNVENPDKNSPTKRIYKDITEESNINYNRNTGEDGRIIDVAAMADIDNDGDPDLVNSIYYHRWEYYNTSEKDPGDRSEVMLNDGNGHFTLVENNGLHDFQWKDLIWSEKDTAFIPLPAGIINTTGICFIDYNMDGNLDLFLGCWFLNYKFDEKWKSVLFKGNGDGTFTPTTDVINTAVQPMYGANVTDWNNDGWPDIITSAYCRSGGNLYQNNGNGSFTDVSAIANFNGQLMGGDHGQNLCNWEAVPADFDNDGDMDFLQVQVHGGYNDGEGRTHVTVNEGPENNYHLEWDLDRIHRDAPTETHLGDQGGSWVDIDNDGLLDIAIGQMAYPAANIYGQERLYICKQDQYNEFNDISKALGIYYTEKEAHSIESCDFDLDGDMDIFFSRQHRDTVVVDTVIDGENTKYTHRYTYMRIELLRNDIGNSNNWIAMKLNAPESTNQSAIGARMTVCSGNLRQIREIQAGLGHCAQQQHFIRNVGIEKKNYIDSIIVRWPNMDMQQTVVYNPPTNVILDIDETGNNESIVKNWEGIKAVIALSKPYLEQKLVNVGESTEMEFKIKNLGDAELNVSSLSFADNSEGVYKLIDTEAPFTIAPLAERTVKVKYTPTAVGWNKDELIIVSDAYNAPEKRLDLFFSGYAPSAATAFDKTIMVYDSLFLGEEAELTFNITNIGERPLEISEFVFENMDKEVFFINGDDKNITVPVNESQDVKIIFRPGTETKFTAPREYISVIKVVSNAYNQDTNSVRLVGLVNGPAPEIKSNKTILNFSNVEIDEEKEMELEITNWGNADLTIHDYQISENDVVVNDGVFEVPSSALPLIVAPETTEELPVILIPQEEKKYRYKLELFSNAYKDSVKTIQLWATGKPNAVLENSFVDNEDLFIQVTPNPVVSSANIHLEVKNSLGMTMRLILADSYGREAAEIHNGQLCFGEHNFALNSVNISSGFYYLIAIGADETYFIPLVIVK